MADRQDEQSNGKDVLTNSLTRRTFLGATAASLALASLPESTSASITTDPAPGTVVDLGDKGLSDGDAIDPYLDDYWTDDTEVHVPAGTYTLNDGDRLGIDSSQDAWLVGDGDVYLEGDPNNFNAFADNGAHVRYQNLTITGEADEDGLDVCAWDADAVVELINFNMPNGGLGSAAYHKNEHAGIARWINCHIEAFDSDGIYASSFAENDSNDGHGTIEIYGGLYANCGVNCIRVGGDDSKVISAAVVSDTVPDIDGGTYGAIRGIRVREAGENQIIDDCDITVASGDNFGPAIVVADERFEGEGPTDITVTNTRISNASSDNTVDTNTSDANISGDTLHITGGGDYELEGEGPYTDVYYDGDADEPTTQKRWYDWDGSGDDDSDTSVAVTTDGATEVTGTSAVLEGTLTDLGGADSADVSFEYRETGASSWNATATRTLSSTGSFDESVSDLTTGTEYEFRAVAAASDGDTDTGGTSSFTPMDLFEIEPTGSTDVTYEFTIDGDVELATSGDNPSDGDESITQNDDGTVTVSDSTGGGDSFYIAGTFVELTVGPDGEYQLYLNGNEVTVDDLLGDTDVDVRTDTATSVDENSATLEGSLADLGDASSADVEFEYREASADTWNATATQTLSSTGSFSETVSGLSSGTSYEFRACASASDGDTDTGSTDSFSTVTSLEHHLVIRTPDDSGILYSFTTDGTLEGGDTAEVGGNDTLTDNGDGTYTADGELKGGYEDDWYFDGSVTDWSDEKHPDEPNSDFELVLDGTVVTVDELTGDDEDTGAPAVDSYSVSETGSPNPHVEISADWTVSDAEGNLSWVLVQVVDGDGYVVDASKESVGGDSASGTDSFEIKHVDGQTFDVTLLVTDEAGNEAEATRTVTE